MDFKVQIINIENNVNNILLTDGLTIEILKIKYNWVLNASLRNAVLGQNDYGLVWYMGEWICGEWENGTWYSGVFHSGTWKNGRWYSYLLDKPRILTGEFTIINEDKIYSQFENGKWYNGEWYNGTFGKLKDSNNNDINISGMTSDQILNETINCPYWYQGNWYNGLFINSVWKTGNFNKGSFVNSYWINGKFYNGIFDNYEWNNGSFHGGDFIRGIWKNGTFAQNSNIPTRFGTCTGTTEDGILTIWENGIFEKGEFMSGLYFNSSGNTMVSQYHNTTHWKNGEFNNGTWWGGHFERGTFKYGTWYGGVFNTNYNDGFYINTTWENGFWYDGIWLNGVFKSGMFLGGMWLNGYFQNGFLVGLFDGVFTESMKINVTPQELPTPILPPPSQPPIVSSQYTYMVNSDISVVGIVLSTGDTQTTRGICYSTKDKLPGIKDHVITDTGVTSGYTCYIYDINLSRTYYIRTWARNQMGTVYGDLLLSAPYPYVMTLEVSDITSNSAKLHGRLVSDGSRPIPVTTGFKYSTNSNLVDVPTTTISTQFALSDFSLTITGLSPSTLYYYVAVASNGYYPSIISTNPYSFTTGVPDTPD